MHLDDILIRHCKYFYYSRNHFFDTEARVRGHRRRVIKPLTFPEVNDPLRGDQPVRARYGYKIILTSKRIGVDFN